MIICIRWSGLSKSYSKYGIYAVYLGELMRWGSPSRDMCDDDDVTGFLSFCCRFFFLNVVCDVIGSLSIETMSIIMMRIWTQCLLNEFHDIDHADTHSLMHNKEAYAQEIQPLLNPTMILSLISGQAVWSLIQHNWILWPLIIYANCFLQTVRKPLPAESCPCATLRW